ncbi:MAG: acyl-homoserine-lactone synthase [Hyphomicrobiaceae bacterium]
MKELNGEAGMLLRFSGRHIERARAHACAMFEARSRVFVGRRGWRALARPDGLERDAADGPAAEYLLLLGPDRGIVAGLRLLPTRAARPVTCVDAALVAGLDLPCGPEIRELTRFFVLKGQGPPGAVRDRLLNGLFAHCRQRGVARLLATIDAGLLGHFRRIGLAMTAIGAPFAFAEGRAIVVLVTVPSIGPAVTFLDVPVGRDLDDVAR